MIRPFLILSFSLMLATGCGGFPSLGGKPANEEAGINVPGKHEGTPTKTEPAPKTAQQLFFDRYVEQCKQQLTAMGPMPVNSAAPKSPEDVCHCVANSAWSMQQKQGTPMDPVAAQKEMMTCMGIDMAEMSRKVEEKQRMAEQMAEQESTEFAPPEVPAESATDPLAPDAAETPKTPPQPQPRRDVKYDPKTGTWSN